MKRTFQWVTIFSVAAGMTAMAQQPTTGGAMSQKASGEKITVQGCLQAGSGSSTSTGATGGTSTYGSTGATGSTGSTGATGSTGSTAGSGSTSTGSTGQAGSSGSQMSGTQGATAQSGQGARAGGQGSTSGSGMYMLRVTDGGSGNANTGMPSSTAGQSDARSAAGQQGGRTYHLMADSSTNLAAHVGHQVEVTGTLESGGQSGSSSSMGARGASGTSGSGSTGSGAAGGTGVQAGTTTGSTTGSTSSTGSSAGASSMQHMAHQATGMIKVTNVKMIAATCR